MLFTDKNKNKITVDEDLDLDDYFSIRNLVTYMQNTSENMDEEITNIRDEKTRCPYYKKRYAITYKDPKTQKEYVDIFFRKPRTQEGAMRSEVFITKDPKFVKNIPGIYQLFKNYIDEVDGDIETLKKVIKDRNIKIPYYVQTYEIDSRKI